MHQKKPHETIDVSYQGFTDAWPCTTHISRPLPAHPLRRVAASFPIIRKLTDRKLLSECSLNDFFMRALRSQRVCLTIKAMRWLVLALFSPRHCCCFYGFRLSPPSIRYSSVWSLCCLRWDLWGFIMERRSVRMKIRSNFSNCKK